MQQPKYDKNEQFYRHLYHTGFYNPYFFHPEGWATISFHAAGCFTYKVEVWSSIEETPMEIYDRTSFKEHLIGKFRVTFASVRFANVTVQVV